MYGFQDVTVTQMYKDSIFQKQYMPLFFMSMPKIINELFNLDELMGTHVVVEPYKGEKGPCQHHNCQGWFHSA